MELLENISVKFYNRYRSWTFDVWFSTFEFGIFLVKKIDGVYKVGQQSIVKKTKAPFLDKKIPAIAIYYVMHVEVTRIFRHHVDDNYIYIFFMDN